jgi:hypothetical protein
MNGTLSADAVATIDRLQKRTSIRRATVMTAVILWGAALIT